MKRCYNLGPEQVKSIDSLSIRMNIDKTNVVTNGVRVLREAVAAAVQGGRLAVIGADKEVTLISGPWDDLRPTG